MSNTLMKDKNIDKAYTCLELAEKGKFKGKKVTKLLIQYFDLIKKSAYLGNAEGQFLFGTLLQDEDLMKRIGKNNVLVNQKRALYWYEKACGQNQPEACHNLGGIYGMGQIVEKNRNKEITLYMKAFDLGLAEAGYAIAMTYKEDGNYKSTIYWLNKILEGSPNDGEVLFELAKLYYEGLGVRRSYERAYNLFISALKTNYITEYSREEIYFYLGKMYLKGQFVEKTAGKAKYLFEKANVDADHEDINMFLNKYRKDLKSVPKIRVLL